MQKVYLLLRNNQQTGPYSVDELVQKGLKPYDLIWVEGRSAGWSYPSEVDVLKPFLGSPEAPVQQAFKTAEPAPAAAAPPPLKKPASQKVFVSLPVHAAVTPSPAPAADTIEEKAEALRKKIQSQASVPAPDDNTIKTNYARTLHSVEADYTSWIYQKKTKRPLINKKGILVLSVVMAGLAGGWWIANVVFSQPVAAVNKRQPVENAEKGEAIVASPAPEETQTETPVVTFSNTPKKTVALHSAPPPAKKQPASEKGTKGVVTATEAGEAVVHHEPETPAVSNESPAVVTEETKDPAVAEKPKEKRTLKTLFNTLFKKNKKEEAAAPEEKAAESSSSERKATRRTEETSGTVNTIDIADQVTVKTNKNADEEWMTGVQGLKLTLINQSTIVLKAAEVEVRYYSEQNELLYKKNLQFADIAPKKSQTIPAPDHRLADHVDYRILSATGVDNAYVTK